jgi:hypothetical protein
MLRHELTSAEQDRRLADERRGSKGVQNVWASAAEEFTVQDAKGEVIRLYRFAWEGGGGGRA